jgi:hypothetical protein
MWFLRGLLLPPIVAMAMQLHAAEVQISPPPERLPVAEGPDSGSVEPDFLPGNTAAPGYGEFAAPEPPLPEREGPEVVTPTEQHPEEVSATPRRFRYAITVEVRGVYDDNVTLSRGADRRDDVYGALMPQLNAGVGDVDTRQENYVALNYTPTALFYVDNSDFNTIEQVGRLEGQWRIRRVALRLTQDYASVQSSNLNVADPDGGFANQTNLDIGGRRRVTRYATRLDASAELTGKTSLRLGASYSVDDPEDLIGSDTLTATAAVDYRYGPKLSLGLGVTGGKQYVDEPSPDTTFQQVNVRGTYEVTGKIRATGSAGVEFRGSDDGIQQNISPVFAVGLAYAPFDGTQLDVSATRRTLNSASAIGQDFTSTQLIVTARQRFLQRIFANLSAGIQEQTYFSTFTGVSTDRKDNYYFIAAGIDVRITEFWFAGLFFTHRANQSSLDFYTFDNNQYGIRTTLTF